MAMNQFDIPYRSVAIGVATAKTVVGVKAATNVALKLLEASITTDGATSNAIPAVVDFNRITFATNGPGTNSSSVTPLKRDPGRAETIQATAAFTWSTEPTVLTANHSKDIPVYNGVYHYLNPFSSPHIIVGGQGFGITVTAPAAVNVTGHLTCEE